MARTFTAGSGVSTCTVPSVRLQYLRTLSSAAARRTGGAQPLRERARLLDVASGAEAENDLPLFAVGQFERHLDRAAGVECRAQPAGKPRSRQGVGIRGRAVPAEEFGAIPAQRPRQVVDVEEGDPARKLAVVGVSREQRAARGVDLGDDVGRGLRAQVAEHPLDESGGRQAPRAAGSIAHLEHRELDRILDVHVDPELGVDAAGGVLEDAVAESVAGPVRHRTARREGRRRPEVAAFLVAQVDRLAAVAPTGSPLQGVRRNSWAFSCQV